MKNLKICWVNWYIATWIDKYKSIFYWQTLDSNSSTFIAWWKWFYTMKCDHCGALYIQFHHPYPLRLVCAKQKDEAPLATMSQSPLSVCTLLNECSRALGWMNTTFLSPDCFIVFDHCPLQLSLAALDSIAHFRIVFHRWEKWMNNCSDAIMALLYTTVSTNLLHYEYLGQKQWWWLRAILFLEAQYCCQTKFYHLGA